MTHKFASISCRSDPQYVLIGPYLHLEVKCPFSVLCNIEYCTHPSFRVGWSNLTTFRQYDSMLKLHRREISKFIGSLKSTPHILEVEEKEVGRFLVSLLEKQEQLSHHIRT